MTSPPPGAAPASPWCPRGAGRSARLLPWAGHLRRVLALSFPRFPCQRSTDPMPAIGARPHAPMAGLLGHTPILEATPRDGQRRARTAVACRCGESLLAMNAIAAAALICGC